MQLWAMQLVEELSPQLRGWGEAQNEGARGLMGLQAHQKLLPGLSPPPLAPWRACAYGRGLLAPHQVVSENSLQSWLESP